MLTFRYFFLDINHFHWEYLNFYLISHCRLELIALNEELTRHDILYYEKNVPEISDGMYDKLCKRAEDLTGRFNSLRGIVKKLEGVSMHVWVYVRISWHVQVCAWICLYDRIRLCFSFPFVFHYHFSPSYYSSLSLFFLPSLRIWYFQFFFWSSTSTFSSVLNFFPTTTLIFN